MPNNHMLRFCSASAVALAITLNAGAYELPDWQSELPDAAYVSTLSLPGAHDAATGEGFAGFLSGIYASTSQAQTKTLNEIYNAGVRVIDFRPSVKNNRLKCYHGIAETNKWFDEALREMCTWLDQHPKEFFIVHLYTGNDNGDINNLMNALLAEDAVATHLIQFKPDMTVGEIRGKILFFKRDGINWDSQYATPLDRWYETDNLLEGYELRGRIYPYKPGTTNRYDRKETYLLVQDKACTNNAVDQKKSEAKQVFDFMSTWCPTTEHNMVWTFNFASAYTGSTSSASGYADNANTMNPYFMDCLAQSNGPAGMVMIDFVGADTHNVSGASATKTTYSQSLVAAVIDQNFKYIDSYVDRQVTELSFENRSWSGVLWDHMFYGNNFFADINGNGYMDYVIASSQQDNGTAFFTINDQSGWFNFMTERVFGTNHGNHVIIPIDYNNDGNLDLILAKASGSRLYENTGNGNFELVSSNVFGTTIAQFNEDNCFDGRMAVIDANHNGLKDIVTFGTDGYPKLFVNNGDGSFTATEAGLPKIKKSTLATGDYDGDGFADLLISGKNESGARQASIAISRHDLPFEVTTPESLQPYATYQGGVMFVDMNMDGQPDIFMTGRINDENRYGSNGATLLINCGNGEFTVADVLTDPVYHGNADWADLTGNGRPDIVYAGENHLGYYTSTIINADQNVYKTESSMDGHRAAPSVCAFDYNNTGRASVGVMGHSWDASKNQMYDTKSAYNTISATSALADSHTAETVLYGLSDDNPDKSGIGIEVWNPEEIPSGYLYNYVVKLKDGRLISNVPVNPATGTLLTADVNNATSSPAISYPSINKADVESYAVQIIGPDKKGSILNLSDNGITTGIDTIEPADRQTEPEYYNLQGIRVSNPSNGVYIKRQGNKISKVLL